VLAPRFAVAAVSLPEVPGFAPKLTIYLAKGEANSCGKGCDRWIAIEGKVDIDAAARVGQFLHGVKDSRLPIYFHSVALIAGSEKPPSFEAFPARQGGYEIWSAVMAADAVKNLFAQPRLEVGESTSLSDGTASQAMFEIETRGLDSSWTQLSAICAAPPSSALHTIDMPGSPKAPAL
jgi:hypothetical protein